MWQPLMSMLSGDFAEVLRERLSEGLYGAKKNNFASRPRLPRRTRPLSKPSHSRRVPPC